MSPDTNPLERRDMDPKAIAANINPIDIGSTATISVVLLLIVKWLTDRHTKQLDELLVRQDTLESQIAEMAKRLEELTQ